MSSSRGPSRPRDRTRVSPALASGFSTASATWEALSTTAGATKAHPQERGACPTARCLLWLLAGSGPLKPARGSCGHSGQAPEGQGASQELKTSSEQSQRSRGLAAQICVDRVGLGHTCARTHPTAHTTHITHTPPHNTTPHHTNTPHLPTQYHYTHTAPPHPTAHTTHVTHTPTHHTTPHHTHTPQTHTHKHTHYYLATKNEEILILETT